VWRLRNRIDELTEAIFARIYALEPARGQDVEYVEGLRTAVRGGVEYGLAALEGGDELEALPFPKSVVEQARRAARSGVSLETALRRYAAGDRMLAEFVLEEAGDHYPLQALRQLMRVQAPHVDRLMASMANAYMQELERIRFSPAQRLAEAVEQLLAGAAPAEVEPLDYELEGWHIGLIVDGLDAARVVRDLTADLDRVPLVVRRGETAVWAWLGGRERLDFAAVERHLVECVRWSVGEPRRGLDGWRLTHIEAQAAHQVMLRSSRKVIRGSDVLLEAAVLRDEGVAESLRRTYLEPLGSDTGRVLRDTLRAYLSSGRNAATAAAVLGVDRHTVQRRLRKSEEALGRLLHTCHAELDVVLTLAELEGR
jgi:PucR C-terminal helix-turn-helix domain/GGDEF-like domain